MKNKKVSWVIIAIICVIILSIIAFIIYGFSTMESPNKTSTEQEIAKLNQDYQADIMIYGDNIAFDSDLIYRNINNINNDELIRPSYANHFIIINNLSNKIELNIEEANVISSLVIHNRYTFIYVGAGNEEVLIESGLLEYSPSSSCRGFYTGYTYGSFLHKGSEIIDSQDIKTFDAYPNLLGDLLIKTMIDIIESGL